MTDGGEGDVAGGQCSLTCWWKVLVLEKTGRTHSWQQSQYFYTCYGVVLLINSKARILL